MDDAKRVVGVLREAESRAYPAVFRGINESWPAINKWAGQEGLAYPTQAAGPATVQVRAAKPCPSARLHPVVKLYMT